MGRRQERGPFRLSRQDTISPVLIGAATFRVTVTYSSCRIYRLKALRPDSRGSSTSARARRRFSPADES